MFGLKSDKWHANVQPHSGSSANLAVYLGLLKPGDKILAMDLAQGGHLTHGSPVNFSGKLFKFIHYGVDKKSCLLNYKKIEKIARRKKPKMIVCGATAYPRLIDFKKFSAIAKKVNALLLADISHIAGLIVAGVHPSPFPWADIITSTTHKTLAGPRSAFIICRAELAKEINKAVFPGLQGGPLDNIIAAKAICFEQALSKNLRPLKLSGKEAADLLEEVEIYTNANMIPYDPATPLNPSGLRLGTPALSTRGMKEKEMRQIGLWISEILHRPDDKKLRQRIKKEVLALTKKFPIY
jgi:glycine hydroxymethyltransferase